MTLLGLKIDYTWHRIEGRSWKSKKDTKTAISFNINNRDAYIYRERESKTKGEYTPCVFHALLSNLHFSQLFLFFFPMQVSQLSWLPAIWNNINHHYSRQINFANSFSLEHFRIYRDTKNIYKYINIWF